MESAIETKFMLLMTGINTREQQKAALSLATTLRLRGIMSVFALTQGSVFAKIFNDKGYEVVFTSSFPQSKGLLSSIVRKLKMQSCVQEATQILKVKSINAVLSFGGITAHPVLEAATKINGIKIMLFEGNVAISKCGENFMKKADRIYFPFETMQESIDYEFYKKSFVAGIPVDKDILKAEPADIQTKKRKLLILTCRKEMRDINSTVRELITKYPEITRDFHIIHETGDREIAAIQRYYETNKIENTCEMFFDNRGAYYKVADIVIARPNSDIIAELIALKKPAVYLPLPKNKDYFQKQNAVFMAKKSMGYIVEDAKSVNAGVRMRKLYSFLNSYLKNEASMKKNMAELDFENSAVRLADDIEKILKSGKK
ncbi:UDP-N-acetylglucosamine--N-acetylmuramyl-(pentapeptide) pyrophosphoryl-undecaprenol N-acetylglucosamine transferase [bacterium]|nr:UDP-N-acetylglucosamine--N-acetylmuramyl-(pentapeptide) pyrophosphoryl-undecaprenol N-acetylglucosamine transferase [bacterium]